MSLPPDEGAGWEEWGYGFYDGQRERTARAIRDCLGRQLREFYRGVVDQDLPDDLAEILRRLDGGPCPR